ncbi:hypothetical protein GCM10007424_13100 [Flavobacterium suaedae]|uniref:Type IV secretion system putative lipoprotein virB7 n=1 Tax=Flavobacterium suaedae TaxID=1767027 RepID=A0ABQ1JSJ2_9FLAO|nr:lipocalin family protein [Flavobacterium suaedae]GGB74548.1 hypothetical protein GCM10007424_13100 [Flavobacterium suaedae]
MKTAMKNVKKFLFLFSIAAVLTACSDDDDAGASAGENLAGTYNLTAYNVPVAVDFNQDTQASTNLMNESDCYLDSQIILNSDNTYTSTYNYLLITDEASCEEEERMGNWSSDNDNTLTLIDTSVEPELEVDYTVNNDQILLTLENSPYPDRDGEGNVMYSTGTVVLVYTKIE